MTAYFLTDKSKCTLKYLAFIICQFDFFSIKTVHSITCQIINIKKTISFDNKCSNDNYICKF